MNRNKIVSTIRLVTLGLLVCFLWAGMANAAPLYRGKFTLPCEVRWGQAVLPAGEYLLRFQDIGTRVFVVIRDVKSGKEVALPAPLASSDVKGTSALLIASEGSQRVVHSLRLGEVGEVFVYEAALVRAAGDAREAHTMQTLPVLAAKN
ncbi:MAG: hypothetical protein LAO56_18500 [Acidobacteriia bacterium]|nr:hypothetical protein [Terriglobia bacterium]